MCFGDLFFVPFVCHLESSWALWKFWWIFLWLNIKFIMMAEASRRSFVTHMMPFCTIIELMWAIYGRTDKLSCIVRTSLTFFSSEFITFLSSFGWFIVSQINIKSNRIVRVFLILSMSFKLEYSFYTRFYSWISHFRYQITDTDNENLSHCAVRVVIMCNICEWIIC